VYCVWQVVKTPTIISNNPVQHSLSGLSNGNALCSVWGTNRIFCVWRRSILVCKDLIRFVFTAGHKMDERKLCVPYTLRPLVRMSSFCFDCPPLLLCSPGRFSSMYFTLALHVSLLLRCPAWGQRHGWSQWRNEGGVWGVQPPPPEIPKALQKIVPNNPIVKTVKNCWI
jgi:hypothetical protein